MTKNYDWYYHPSINASASLSQATTNTLKGNKNLIYSFSQPLQEQYNEAVVTAQRETLDKLLRLIN